MEIIPLPAGTHIALRGDLPPLSVFWVRRTGNGEYTQLWAVDGHGEAHLLDAETYLVNETEADLITGRLRRKGLAP